MRDERLIDPNQIAPSKEGYSNLSEQLNFGKFNTAKSTAAPTLLQEVVAEEGQSLFSIPNGSFTMGDDSLQVFVNGLYMRRGEDKDYVEISQTQIQFNFELEKDEVVVFRVAGGTTGPHLLEHHTAVAGQTLFSLIKSYAIGNDSLQVYRNGLLQKIGDDYEEVNTKSVRLLHPTNAGDTITFRVEGTPASELKYKSSNCITTLDQHGRLIREEFYGDENIVHEYKYDEYGRPETMITREGGFIITKRYEWINDLFPKITTTVEGVS